MGDYTETFRIRLDLGDIGGAAGIVEREVARIRSLIATAGQSIPGTSAIAAAGARAELVGAVPAVQRSAAELQSAAPPDVFGAGAPYNALASRLEQQAQALTPAVAALGVLPTAIAEAGRVGAKAEAAARAALADLATGGGPGRGGGGGGPVPFGLTTAAEEAVKRQASYEAAEREDLVAVVAKRIEAERAVAAIMTEVESQARIEIAERSHAVPAQISQAATGRVTELAELEAADRGELVATVRTRIGAEEKIRAIQAEVEAQARAELGAGAGARATTVPAAITNASTSRVEQLAALEAADRGELVSTVRQRLEAEQKIRTIEQDVEKQARSEMAAVRQGQAGGQGQASVIQRLQAYIGGNKKDAEEYRGLGQILSSRALTSGTFAVTGFAAFQAVSTIRGMVEEAQKAEQALNRLRAQFNAVGESDAFPKVAEEINSIARDTGVAVDQVAQMAGTMKGAFIDTTLAVQQTRQAVEGMQALGLNNAEAQNVLTANALTFYGRTGDAIQKVSDESLHLHDVFGPAAKDIATGVANIGPLAQEMGLSFDQTATLIAGAAARSGRAVQQVANEIGRALTQVEKQQIPILRLFQEGGPQAQAAVPNIAEAIRNQQPGQVLLEVVKHWHDLSAAQQETFLQMVGGRREAASLAAALGASDDIVKELGGSLQSHGRTAKEVAALHQSLAYQLGRFREEIRQIGDNLTRAGLGQFLADIARAGGVFLGVLNGLLGALASINEFTHGWAGRLLEVIVILKLLQAFSGTALFERILFGSAGGFGGIQGLGAKLSELALAMKSEGILSAAKTAGAGLIGSPLGKAGLALGIYGAGQFAQSLAPEGTPPVFSALGNVGAGAAFGGPVGAAIGGAISVAQEYSKERSGVKKAADDFKQRLSKATTDRLREMVGDVHSSFFEKVGDSLFGQETPENLIQKELGRRYADTADRRIKALETSGLGTEALRKVTGNKNAVFDDKFAKQLEDMIRAGGKQGEAAIHFLNELNATVADKGPAAIQRFHDALAAYDAGKSQKAADDLTKLDPKTGISAAAQSAQEIMSSLQAGSITQDEAIRELNKIKSAYDVVGKVTDPAQAKELATIVKDIATIQGQKAREAIDLRLELEKATGTEPTQTAQEAAQQYGQLAGRQDVDENTRKQAAKDAVKAVGEQFNALLAAAKTADDINNLLKGIPVPPEVLAMAAQQGISVPAVTQLTREQKDQVFSKFQQITTAQEQYAKSLDQGDPVKSALDSQAKATKDVAEALAIFGKSSPEYQAALTELNNANQQIHQADVQMADLRSQVRQSRFQRDPVSQTAEALRQARDDLASARGRPQDELQAQVRVNQLEEELRQRQEDVTKAWESYREALDAGNPVQAAQDAVEAANRALSIAVPGTAAYIDAQKAVVEANRRLADAQRAMASAQLDYLIAVANSADDALGADALRLQQLQNSLKDAQQKGDVTGATQISAQIVDQMKKMRDDQIATTERNVDFQLQMGQISTQAAIARLRGLLSLVQGDEKQTQEILLRIHQLEQQASQNATFDIPQDIRLPTLYEARRLRQSEAAGYGYNDNRIVQVQYNAFGAQDHASNLDDLQGLLAGAPRAGVTPRAY